MRLLNPGPAALALLTLLSLPVWAEEMFRPGDFAGAMVYSGREGSLLMLEIPGEVYEGFRRPDLGDIRIFDASENPVPFVIREKPKEFFTPPPEPVPFFAWDGGREKQFPANTDIEINTSGAVVRIKNQSDMPGSQSVYLIDLSTLRYAPSALAVNVDNRGENFNTPVTIHYSGDLSNWISFDRRQVLASFGGSSQNLLELPESHNMRYLLVSFGWETPRPLAMTVSFKAGEKPAEFHEVVIHGRKSVEGKTVNYNTEAFYPAEFVDFILEEADSIPVLIKNRFSEKEEWKIHGREIIFRYNSSTSGGITKNPAFETSSNNLNSRSPYWELETTGGLPFTAAPDMVIRWKPKEIIFPGRGKGPWTLAYGNADSGPLGSGGLLPSGSDEPEPAVFTGEKRYEKTGLPRVAPEKKYREYLLWIFLGAVVLILSILAYSIAKSMKS
jgi:hypothetical protein